jgi:hypothetical protein
MWWSNMQSLYMPTGWPPGCKVTSGGELARYSHKWNPTTAKAASWVSRTSTEGRKRWFGYSSFELKAIMETPNPYDTAEHHVKANPIPVS